MAETEITTRPIHIRAEFDPLIIGSSFAVSRVRVVSMRSNAALDCGRPDRARRSPALHSANRNCPACVLERKAAYRERRSLALWEQNWRCGNACTANGTK